MVLLEAGSFIGGADMLWVAVDAILSAVIGNVWSNGASVRGMLIL